MGFKLFNHFWYSKQKFLVRRRKRMKWLLIYRLSSGHGPDLIAIYSTYHRLSSELPTWVDQCKDTYSWSTSSLSTIIILFGIFHIFSFLSSIFFFPLPTYFHLYFYCACWVSVCNWRAHDWPRNQILVSDR